MKTTDEFKNQTMLTDDELEKVSGGIDLFNDSDDILDRKKKHSTTVICTRGAASCTFRKTFEDTVDALNFISANGGKCKQCGLGTLVVEMPTKKPF